MLLPERVVQTLRTVYRDLHGPESLEDVERPEGFWPPLVQVDFRLSQGARGTSVALVYQDREFRVRVSREPKPPGKFRCSADFLDHVPWVPGTFFHAAPVRVTRTPDGAVVKIQDSRYPMEQLGSVAPLIPREPMNHQERDLYPDPGAAERFRRCCQVANSHHIPAHDRLPGALLIRGTGCWTCGTDRALMVAVKVASVENSPDWSCWIPGNQAEMVQAIVVQQDPGETTLLSWDETNDDRVVTLQTPGQRGSWRYRQDHLDRALQHLGKILEEPRTLPTPGLLDAVQWAWDQHDARWPLYLVPDLGANWSFCFHETTGGVQVVTAVPQDPDGNEVKLLTKSLGASGVTLPLDTWYDAEKFLFGLKTVDPAAQWACGALDNITDSFPVLYCLAPGIRVVLAAQRNTKADEALAKLKR